METVEQELLFVGTENGKLVAMRDIIKKVQPNVLSKLVFLNDNIVISRHLRII